MRYLFILLSLLSYAPLGITQETLFDLQKTNMPHIVVKAKSMSDLAQENEQSLMILESSDIKTHSKTNPVHLLQSLPGVSVSNSGGVGRHTSVFIRGTNANHTTILIDGIELNDPSSGGKSFDFGSLNLDFLEKIEVLKGPRPSYLGTNSMGGVINLTTIQGKGPYKTQLATEMGAYNTVKGSLGTSGGNKKFHLTALASHQSTDGFSVSNDGAEKDGSRSTHLRLKSGGTIGPIILNSTFLHNNSVADLDSYQNGRIADDPNSTSYHRDSAGRVQIVREFQDYKTELSYFNVQTKRGGKNDPDAINNERIKYLYKSQLHKIQTDHTFILGDYNSLLLGGNLQQETASSVQNNVTSLSHEQSSLHSIYTQHEFHYQNLHTNLSLNGAKHDRFNNYHYTYRVAPAYHFPFGTTIKLGHATGFKAPSLYQLYEPRYGNDKLGPEKSRNYEVTLEQKFKAKKAKVHTTFFYNKLNNLIDLNQEIEQYYNEDNEIILKGAETGFSTFLNDNFELAVSYTKLMARKRGSSEQLSKRPKEKYSLNLIYKRSRWHGKLQFLHVGARKDTSFSNAYNDTYNLLHLYVAYKVSAQFEITSRLQNITNEQYELAAGYGTPGRSFYTGLKLEI